MLHYRRRNRDEPLPMQQNNSVPALVGFCNYSYDRQNHIDRETLRNILLSFNEDYIYLYLRIFNEASSVMLRSFMELENINPQSLISIYRTLLDRGFDLRELNKIL